MIDPRTIDLLERVLDTLASNIEKAAPVIDRPGTKTLLRKLRSDVAMAQGACRIIAGEYDSMDPVTAMAIEIGKSARAMGRRPRGGLRLVVDNGGDNAA